jgi:hypothetical protein
MTKRALAILLAAVCMISARLAAPARAADTIRLCPKMIDDCTHTSVRKALADAGDGATIRIATGIYTEGGTLSASRVRIEADPGATLLGAEAAGKGALVIRGDDTIIEGLTCSGVEVPSGNGACVRQEGKNLTLRKVHFHHNQAGLLSVAKAGVIVIEDSVIEDNGIGGGGQGHNISVAGDALEFRRSKSLRARGEGDELRSTAARTVIEDSVIASLQGDDSRLINVASGGEVVVRNSVLEEGPDSVNHGMIGFALSGSQPSSLELSGNTIILDGKQAQLLQTRPGPQIRLRANTIIGGAKPRDGDSKWFPDREAAGYPPFPGLDR